MRKLHVRPERATDYQAVNHMLASTFNREDEARLVQKLRLKEEFIPKLSLLAEYEGEIFGYLLLFPLSVISGSGKNTILSLSTMAVDYKYQSHGIGEALIENGLKKAKALGYNAVTVFDSTGYFLKFGFRKASEFKLQAPVNMPDDDFLAMELQKNALKKITGTINYPFELMREQQK